MSAELTEFGTAKRGKASFELVREGNVEGMKITVGTRGSLLATTQTGMVVDAIRKLIDGVEIEIKTIKTKGDLDLETSLNKMGNKGIFVGEIEQALQEGSVDIAIHSMKDMPTSDTEGLILLPIMKREEPGDLLITKHNIKSYKELPKQPVIGTGSKRRSYQLFELVPDAVLKPIRGNVDTRIRKMLTQDFDAIVLASAGVNRLGITSCDDYQIIPFNKEEMIPAPAQGILGLQLRSDRHDLMEALKPLIDEETALQAAAERQFLETVEGGCHMPVGAYLTIDGEIVTFSGIFGDEEGTVLKRIMKKGTKETAVAIAKKAALEIIKEVNNG